ncbi:MAG: 30S ribosomal protein S8 [Thermoplasmatales archaeon]|nr:30S ribosomal protein S8 [Thermoplasmatales archaeon]
MADTLNDALISIKNASRLGRQELDVRASNLVGRVLRVFQKYGYIEEYEYVENGKGGLFKVKVAKTVNNCGVIKPRFAIKRDELERWESRYLPAQDIGILVISTTSGVMSNTEAKKKGTGGRALAFIY